MSIFIFPSRKISTASQLPLTLISLEEWALVSIQGIDSSSYLQTQLTIDICSMERTRYYFAAHCNAQGKMWSNLCLFHHRQGYSYLLRRSVCEQQISELKKYAIFSKVTIIPDNNIALLGIAGVDARFVLSNFFNLLPNAKTSMIEEDETVILWFSEPKERFLLATTFIKAQQLKDKLIAVAQFNNSNQWVALDIEAGIPIIDSPNSAKLIPQATNLQMFNAISFKKGCYIGQEIVTRTKFRGTNKHALYWLLGKCSLVPKLTDSMELQIGSKWRKTGIILSAVKLEDGNISAQVVLNNNLKPDSIFRLNDDNEGKFTIQTLPYSMIQ